MVPQLPSPINTYFAAANTGDADRVAGCFKEDAVVRDEGQDFVGRDAILAWAREARRKYRFNAQPLAIEGSAESAVVTAHLTGDFPRQPCRSPLSVPVGGRTHCSLGDRLMSSPDDFASKRVLVSGHQGRRRDHRLMVARCDGDVVFSTARSALDGLGSSELFLGSDISTD